MFYNADPAEFIKMRIEAISLMACTDEQLAPAFGADRTISTSRVGDKGAPEVSARFGAMKPPDLAARKRYIRMESVMIAHHASEALLRLFFAHVEHEECPWLGMSASTDFAEFKGKVSTALEQGFDRAQIAMVFLGGDSPADACIQLSDNEFDDAIGAIDLLLTDAGLRFIRDSFLYNAVKHGVTAVAIDDDEAEVAFRSDDGITSRHCPTAESPRRDIEPEPLQRGRHVARRRRDTSHARPYHMRARVRRPSNSRS